MQVRSPLKLETAAKSEVQTHDLQQDLAAKVRIFTFQSLTLAALEIPHQCQRSDILYFPPISQCQ